MNHGPTPMIANPRMPFRLMLVTLAGLCVGLMFHLGQTRAQTPSPLPLILDTDTANEIDDLYAVTRLLHQGKYQVIAINSTQWLHHLGDPKSVQASQKVNEDLLRIAGRTDIEAILGAEFPMGKPWGGDEPQDSPAAQFIIKTARALPANQKLTIACIGATTNVASAVKLAPDIAGKIKVYLMGFRFDPKTRIWNKSEFNVRRDLDAADFLLNSKEVELHIMPAQTCLPLTFDRDTTFEQHKQLGAYGAYLTQKWNEHCPKDTTRVMWDLALVQAMLLPKMVTELQVIAPPENTQRIVYVYTALNADAMRKDYWESCKPKSTNP